LEEYEFLTLQETNEIFFEDSYSQRNIQEVNEGY